MFNAAVSIFVRVVACFSVFICDIVCVIALDVFPVSACIVVPFVCCVSAIACFIVYVSFVVRIVFHIIVFCVVG